jgi:hypothetical protein
MNGSIRFGLGHLDRMSDHRGLFEHAKGTVPRPEHGYCTDDNARLLAVASRQPDTGTGHRLSRLALAFVLDAQDDDGRCRNRLDQTGRWLDAPSTQDWWGRSLWGLGVAATVHADPLVRAQARAGFERGARQRSRHPRSMAFAAIGAASVVTDDVEGDPRAARALLADALDVIGACPTGSWSWPEPRLAYANAALAEAVIVAGAALERPADLDRGLTMLRWLLERETASGHLSVTGVGGRGPDDRGPQFDQQPIEAAAMADACWRAHSITGNREWSRGVAAAAGWFDAENDTGLPMYDDRSGGGLDGLQPEGVNLNQGAESTLAFVSTMQRARSFVVTP